MEPVEINAGRFYLRALRADERVDDRPALAALGEADPDAAIAVRVAGWADESDLTWAACLQTEVDLVVEIRCRVVDEHAVVHTRPVPGHPDGPAAAAEGAAAVTRFAEGALGLTVRP